MPLLHVLAILVIIGVILYCINHYAPIDAMIKNLITGIVVVAILVWLCGLYFPDACASVRHMKIG
jgi:hypothetical protein